MALTTTSSPKARFMASPENVKLHKRLIESPEFEVSTDAALLQYAAMMTQTAQPDFNGAAAMGMRMLGAQEFLATLKNMAETVQLPKVVPIGNLDHKV